MEIKNLKTKSKKIEQINGKQIKIQLNYFIKNGKIHFVDFYLSKLEQIYTNNQLKFLKYIDKKLSKLNNTCKLIFYKYKIKIISNIIKNINNNEDILDIFNIVIEVLKNVLLLCFSYVYKLLKEQVIISHDLDAYRFIMDLNNTNTTELFVYNKLIKKYEINSNKLKNILNKLYYILNENLNENTLNSFFYNFSEFSFKEFNLLLFYSGLFKEFINFNNLVNSNLKDLGKIEINFENEIKNINKIKITLSKILPKILELIENLV